MHKPNRLINEKSPYLLQHAYNPVDWYPWGKEAFEAANRMNTPIFLSIGYSTCHWCHVMERESFENKEIANLLNSKFVCVKVDREERPDIDNVYMDAVVAMTGSGGWPLSLFLTPDGKPFYGSTYFPPEDVYGRPGFRRVLIEVSTLWNQRKQDALQQSEHLTKLIQQKLGTPEPGTLTEDTLQDAYLNLATTFDDEHGGFGTAPKFPTPHNLSFLLRYADRTGEQRASDIVILTLNAMAWGGIHDHLGNGFHRYSTDREWLVPHFEKMLYDQALLARAYLEAYQVTKGNRHAETARGIFDYVLRDLRDKSGGFYSAEDADSEGFEGKFYLWTAQEIKDILGDKTGSIVARYYDVREGGNFIPHGGHFEPGKNILRIRMSLEKFASREGLNPTELAGIIEDGRMKLFESRERRTRPHRDDKVLTDWNGLMISALSLGAQVLDDSRYGQAARESADFIIRKMQHDGRLMRRYRDGETAIPGYLTDYAFFGQGLLDLYAATFEERWLEEAQRMVLDMVELFWDNEAGGFFFSGKGNEQLVTQTKDVYDGAIPSGNSVAALLLSKLGHTTGSNQLQEYAQRCFTSFAATVNQQPHAHTQFLMAYDFDLGPRSEIVIAGDRNSQSTNDLVNVARAKFLPRSLILHHPPDDSGKAIEKLVPFLVDQKPLDGKSTAYVCQNYTCNLPTTSPIELEKLLQRL